MSEPRDTRPPSAVALVADVAHWSIPVGIVAAIVVTAFTRDPRSALGCLLAVAADVGASRMLTRRYGDGSDIGRTGAALSATFVAGRLAAKALLLVVAFAFPYVLEPYGTLAGVLVFDATLITVGAVVSARRAFPSGPSATTGR